jgi:hypothetical protein
MRERKLLWVEAVSEKPPTASYGREATLVDIEIAERSTHNWSANCGLCVAEGISNASRKEGERG